jgi:4-phospho-D-threonate 3-dehydrogenase / 4-phospho-D-erythronate 3-dehydrogenase
VAARNDQHVPVEDSRAAAANRPLIAISMGDPAGIGAEIICKALGDAGLRAAARYRIHGSEAAMRRAALAAGVTPFWVLNGDGSGGEASQVQLVDSHPGESAGPESGPPGPTKRGGELSFRWVEAAIRDAQRPAGDPCHADAIVTAPISKTSWNLAGHTRWPGHTELLAERFNSPRSGMLFVGPHLRVMLATIHVPLMEVGRLLTTECVLRAIELAHEGSGAGILPMVRGTGVPPVMTRRMIEHGQDARATKPRIAVCGLNPHAGEGGILGEEDDRIIAPAVAQARAKGIDAHGPLPGDTVFNAAAAPPVGKGLYDCVVAMYHDQGLIPVKLVDREETVNVTVGLPTIRTSPAHGTAFDIAGRNMASAASMRAAITLAIKMAAKS